MRSKPLRESKLREGKELGEANPGFIHIPRTYVNVRAHISDVAERATKLMRECERSQHAPQIESLDSYVDIKLADTGSPRAAEDTLRTGVESTGDCR
jgi:hypothetical protein